MRIKNRQMNMFKLFGILFIGAIIALMPLANLNGNTIGAVYANSINNLEKDISNLDKKVYYEGSVKDDFTANSVIIVLNKEETHKFKTYTSDDFSEIDCV